ncbi:MAG: hypothetical protein ACP5T3_00660 [Candidatus Micrarchaeia archaeon]
MPVDVNDIEIFKARGMTRTPTTAKQQGQAAPQPQAPAEATQRQEQNAKIKSAQEAELEAARKIEEEVKEQLERQAAEEEQAGEPAYAGPAVPEKGRTKVVASQFNGVAGALLVFDVLVLLFFGYQQYALMFDTILKIGLAGFINMMNYAYGTSLLNFVLILASVIAGLLMIFKMGRTYMIAGSVAIMLLVATSFEYITSNATYLAIVSALTFISVVAIAYSRMSAVVVAEEEEEEPEPVIWPKIETF